MNAELTREGTSPLSGTSFSSALVAGLAALIRQADPSLNSQQVREIIINSTRRTAATMDPVFGRGHVDPVRALTGAVESGAKHSRVVPDSFAEPEPVTDVAVDKAKVVGLVMLTVGLLAALCMALYGYLHAGLRGEERER